MASKESILEKFQLLSGGTGGIDNWLGAGAPPDVFERLNKIDADPLPRQQLNQLLLLSHEAGLSEGFFRYYWLTTPDHPYDTTRLLPAYDPAWTSSNPTIQSLDHLYWGLYRLYIDALLFFGNIRSAYRTLRSKTEQDLVELYTRLRFPTNALKARGPALPLRDIAKDDRYLISEMACKSYGSAGSASELKDALLEAWRDHESRAGGRVTVRELLDGTYVKQRYADRQGQLVFSADDILDEAVESRDDLEKRYTRVADAFVRAREAALANTRCYLSMVGDLDVYVATSMRTRQDFRSMAETCERIFAANDLADLHLRYFDPTMGAAEGHEDKGLIECLMVKCAKMLVYCAGGKDSYGKDAEAAMALSLGKPVIFYCDEDQRHRFLRDVHPLSRLINFQTGVAVGAMVASTPEEVTQLLNRTFNNEMEYELEQPKPGYFRLLEKLTRSVVRLQTNDELLRETFWNYYHEPIAGVNDLH